ncbi:MAG: MauE/DoxX family redox-associated membrane protein [Acidobacteriota bacterium]
MKNKILTLLSSSPIQTFSQIILGGIFIYASIGKIAYPLEFAEIIYNYKILPDYLIGITAIILPWIELISGILLILGILVRYSALILSSLLIIFIIAILINTIRGIDINCGCFSVNPYESKISGFLLITRDLLILIPGIIIVFLNKSSKQ